MILVVIKEILVKNLSQLIVTLHHIILNIQIYDEKELVFIFYCYDFIC